MRQLPLFLFRLTVFILILSSLWLLDSVGRNWGYDKFETQIWDQYQQLGLPYTTHKPAVVIIDIGGSSIQQQFGWPFSRKKIVQLTEQLFEQYSARAVVLDMTFPDLKDQKADNALLALAQRKAIIFSQAFSFYKQTPPLRTGFLGGGVITDSVQLDTKMLPQATGYTANHQAVSKAPCIGHISTLSSQDGLKRFVPPLVYWKGKVYPMLSLAVLRCVMGFSELPTLKKQTKNYSYLNALPEMDLEMLLEKKASLRIPYRISPKSYLSIPAQDILQSKIDPKLLKLLQGRIVLVGSSALSAGDRVSTPIAPVVSGVMIHAQLLDWMLTASPAIQPVIIIHKLVRLWIIITMAMLWFLLNRGRVGLLIISVLSLSASWWLFGYYLWVIKQWWLPTLPLLAYMMITFYMPMEWLIAQRTIKRLYRIFGGYLPSEIMRELLKKDVSQVLRPQRKMLSILFVDIEDFTKRAEKSDPEAVAELTQGVLECLTQSIHQHQGTVDKYIGDAVMAFWNAPLEQKNHAYLSIKAAQDMLKKIDIYNDEHKQLEETISIRIGINTGEVIVGDLGTSLRSTYTALGDAVNVASRLQEQAKEMQYHLLIGEATVHNLAASKSKAIQLHEVGNIKLRGRKEYEKIYIPEIA